MLFGEQLHLKMLVLNGGDVSGLSKTLIFMTEAKKQTQQSCKQTEA